MATRTNRQFIRYCLLGIFFILIFSGPAATNVVQAADFTFTVTSFSDGVDDNLGDGFCATVLGPCTLRAAIQEANSHMGLETDIIVPAGTYNLTIAGANESAAAAGDLDIYEKVNVIGNGFANTFIDVSNGDRAFDIQSGADVLIDALTIQGGVAPLSGVSVPEHGGAIRNGGTLQVQNSRLQLNGITSTFVTSGSIPGGRGGAILNGVGGVLTVNFGQILNNSAGIGHNGGRGGGGGAIYNQGNATINGTLIFNNIAGTGGSGTLCGINGFGGDGGAIYNDTGATLTVSNARINNNTAGAGGAGDVSGGNAGALGGSGGAIYNAPAGTLDIASSSIYSNIAGAGGDSANNSGCGAGQGGSGGAGGAIYNDGPMTLDNTTISSNTSGDGKDGQSSGNIGSGGSAGDGGGIVNLTNGTIIVQRSTIADNATGVPGVNGAAAGGDGDGGGIWTDGGGVSLQNSILSLNTIRGLTSSECSGSFTQVFYTLIYVPGVSCSVTADESSIIGTNPALGTLQANGDTLLSHMPDPGSIVINRGDPFDDGTQAYDQRGITNDRVIGGRMDMGAVEAPIDKTFVVDTTADGVDATVGDGICAILGGGCSLRAAVQEANASLDLDAIQLGAGTYELSVGSVGENAAAQGDLDIIRSVHIFGADAENTFVQAGPSAGNGIDRIFETLTIGSNSVIENMTLRYGTATTGVVVTTKEGGAVKVDDGSSLLLNEVVIKENESDNAGAIAARNAQLFVVRSTISNNTSNTDAAAMRIRGSNPSNLTFVVVSNSTISGNTGASPAIETAFEGTAPRVDVEQSLIYGHNVGALGIVSSGEVNISNSILHNNTGAECTQTGGVFGQVGTNLVDDATCAFISANPVTNLDGMLADNGGATPTHGFTGASNAIEAFACGIFNVPDQTGTARPVGALCDVGPLEATSIPVSGPIFTVNTADDNDDGVCSVSHCSLREAINAANSTPNGVGPDEIHFSIPASGPQLIEPIGSSLPALTEPVIIDGYTQPGASENTLQTGNDAVILIQLDGGQAGTGFPNGAGLQLTNSGGHTVRGLSLVNWNFTGILLGANNNVHGNFIGVETDGVTGGLNGEGITIQGASNQVGSSAAADRNVISRGNNNGIGLNTASNNTIQNNYIGTNAAGTVRLPSGNGIGLFNNSDNNIIGGAGADEGNLISGNTTAGIRLDTIDLDGNQIVGNVIGLDANLDTLAIPQTYGVYSLSTLINNIGVTAGGNTIGGNLIGIIVNAGDNTVIEDNTIRDNQGDGIRLSAGANPASNNSILNNLIYNNDKGVTIYGQTSAANQIIGNSIYDNVAEGIDFNNDGVSPNDFGDGDTGPNSLQNFPVIQRVTPGGASTTIQGYLYSSPSSTFTVHFYANDNCDANYHGEGKTPLSQSATVTTNALGYGAFQVSEPSVLAQNTAVTAIATSNATSNSSEFSRCTVASPNNDSWPNAFEIPLVPSGGENIGSAAHTIDLPGQSRWYRFPVPPESRIVVDLSSLPANYDLVLFRDIAQTFDELKAPVDIDELEELNAEFAPEMFTPEMFTPEMFTPEMFTPEMFTPEMFTPEMFTPEMFTPEMFTPEMFTPEMFTPEMFTPEMFTPEMFTPEMFTPEMFTPEMFTPEMFTPEMFTPDQRYFAAAQALSAVAVSGFDGTANEMVIANSWGQAGDFYVRVDGRNGVYDPLDTFQLDVTLLGNECVGLTDFGFTPSIPANVGGGFNTVILIDTARMAASHPPAEMANLQTALNALAAQVNGVIVDLNTFPAIQAANAQADTNFECVFAKNLVAYATKQIVDAYRDASPIEHVVVVGNDDMVPFFRYPDRGLLANEDNYTPPVDENTASQASLRLGYVLSQDTYGASVELNRRNTTLPIPEIPVGRLVETPAEIINVINTFLSTGGIVPAPSTALVTGYDFLDDAANAIEAEFAAGLGISGTVDTLISASTVAPVNAWKANDLRNSLLNSGRHDMVFLAGHFSAFSTLAADYDTRVLAEEIANSTVDMTNSIVFSAGCHSGYNIVNEHSIPGVTVNPDWAQAFARKGALLIAGTGYQYGDTDFVEYSERLYLEFSQALREGSGAVTVGDALVRAKQVYLSETAQMRPIHEKVLLQSTIFGLPMLSIDLPAGRTTPQTNPSIVPSTTSATVNPGLTLGLSSADVSITTNTTPTIKTLENVITETGIDTVFYTGDNGMVINPGEPILPLEQNNVSVSGSVLRGAGFRGGTYTDTPNVIPLNSAATTELRGIHTPFISSVFYPIIPWEINYFDALTNDNGSGETRLSLVPAQFLSDDADSVQGTMRTFDDMDFRLFYSNNIASYLNVTNTVTNTPALASPPTINTVAATENGGNIDFTIEVVGDPSAGIQEVWIVWTACNNSGCNGVWTPVDLTQNDDDSTLWEGSLPLGTNAASDILFMAQAANGVGMVAISLNTGEYYQPDVNPGDPATPVNSPVPVEAPATTLTLLSPQTSGLYGTDVTFSAELMQSGNPVVGEEVEFGFTTQREIAVTDANGIASVTLTLINEPTIDEVRVSYDGSASAAASADSISFTIDPIATTLTLETSNPVIGSGGTTNLSFELRDATGRPLREKTVLLVINDGVNPIYYESVITNLFGNAELIDVPFPPGSYQLDAFFGSVVNIGSNSLDLTNVRYLPSTAQASLFSNTPPVAEASGAYSVAEGGTVMLDGSVSSDVDNQPLHYRWDLDNNGSYETVGITPTFTAANGPAVATVGLEVCDDVFDCDTDTATININNVAPVINSVTNDGPVFAGGNATITVDAADAFDTVLMYGYDCNNDNVFETGPIASSTHVCPMPVVGGAYTVNVQVGDGNDATTGSTIVTVTGNSAPSAEAGGPYNVNEGGSVSVDASASSDPDAGQTLTYAWDMDNNGSYETAGATASFSAAALNGPSTATVGVEVCDTFNACSADTATININNVAPVISSVTNNGPVLEGSSVQISVTASDVIDTLTYAYDCNGDSTFESGTVAASTFTCAMPTAGNITVNVQVNDGDATVSDSTIVQVDANTAPTAEANGPYSVDEGGSVIVSSAGSSDPDAGQMLTFAWDMDNNGSYETAGAMPVFSAATLNGSATATVGLQVCDDFNACGTDTATININNVAPVISSVTNNGPVLVGNNVDITVTASDVIDTLTYEYDCDGDNTFESGPIAASTFTCAMPSAGANTVNVRVSDGDDSVTDSTTVVVNANTAPTAAAGGAYSVDEGSSVSVDASASSDPDAGQTLTYAWDLDNNGSYETSGTTGTFSAAAINGPATATVGLEVCDNLGACDTDTATININNVAPVISSVTNNGPLLEGGSADITVVASDVIDTLTYEYDCDGDSTFENGPMAAATFSCPMPTPGSITVNVRVSDGDDSVTDSTTVTVNANTAPTAAAGGAYSVDEGSSVTVDASASSDPDAGQTLTYAWDLDNNGSYETNGATASFSAAALNGPATATVGLQVCDDLNACDTDTATININNVAPVISSVSNNGPVLESGSADITVAASDVIDTLTYEYDCDGDSTFENGPMAAATFSCVMPTPGSITVNVRVSDGDDSVTSSTTVVVNANTVPTAAAGGPYSVDEGGSVILDGSASSDSDAGQTLTYAWDMDNNGSYETAGSMPVFSAATLNGPATATVGLQVCDDLGACGTDTATINIDNVAPVISSVTNNGPVNAGSTVDITVNATDVIDALTYAFDCDNDSVFESGPVSSNTYACTMPTAGTQTVNVEVSDGDVSVISNTTVQVDAGSNPLTDYCVHAFGHPIQSHSTADFNGCLTGDSSTTGLPAPTLTLMPTGSQNVNVNLGYSGGWWFWYWYYNIYQPTDLAPGAYNNLRIRNYAQLELTAGQYSFKHFRMDYRSKLILDVSNGPIIIDIHRNALAGYRARMEVIGGDETDVLFRVDGSHVRFGQFSDIVGTWVAPNADMRVYRFADVEGALYADRIRIRRLADIFGNPADSLIDTYIQ